MFKVNQCLKPFYSDCSARSEWTVLGTFVFLFISWGKVCFVPQKHEIERSIFSHMSWSPAAIIKPSSPAASKTSSEEQIRWVHLVTNSKTCTKYFVFRTPSILIDCHFGFNMKYLTVVIEMQLNEKCRQNQKNKREDYGKNIQASHQSFQELKIYLWEHTMIF